MCYLLDICVVLVNILKYRKKIIIESWYLLCPSSHFSVIHLNCFMKDGLLSCYSPDWGQNNF